GVVATVGDATVGFAFYVVEGNRCSIGDIYVSKPARDIGADGRMVAAILEKLDPLARLRRIECQSVSIGNRAATDVFIARGFDSLERHYMLARADFRRTAADIEARAGEGVKNRLLDISVRPWQDDDFADAAQIIHRSYRGEHDSRINSQYRSEEGCAELLSILTDHIWCGDFLPTVSRVAANRATNQLVGVLIASRISPGVGHIGQISILPAYQGLGIGRLMVTATLNEYNGRGFSDVSLAVTGANLPALHLYQSCGFKTVHRFPVFFKQWSAAGRR
ncbi:MAG TPA: GNAT family N-acetyltransferase, partial [Blastocatellia bacterium]|nr:GNAT family N-acetyltransferase [Blastocatellia bacterium]